MATLLVGALITTAAVLITTVGERPSSERPKEAEGKGAELEVDLGRRIAEFSAEVVTDAHYRPPDRTERDTVADGVALYLDGKREEAARRLAEADFRIQIIRDTAAGDAGANGADGTDGTDASRGRRYAEIADRGGAAAESRRGWGRVYIALGAPVSYSVQVPHPVADAHSDALGVGILRGAPGGVLVIAGAHRRAGEGNAADMAHRTDTVFHAVCEQFAARRMPGIQVHGFADASDPAHDIVVSPGIGEEGRPRAETLSDDLGEDGFRVCRAWLDSRCQLAGRTNEQGRLAAKENLPFLHVEVNRTVRDDGKLRALAVEAMRAATWPGTASRSPAPGPLGR
ncbi:hypothetical protein [Streptomyces sp. 150FB]|uniref:hypothetical protein n=1 Tax=Streptomyces sp. 150FB TaxID=1576605 RepID=UPI0012374C64|nr:hypothetical protein [Streptomyces sp. 150FB]